ncbi:MAG: hypothetical protein HFP78_07290 [Methylococcales symbiont of Hymedesmia sp. n. MRB-2018]|nr:MAG: hypothetical protein HFP78_07290 [Methylococcales symbiont of Hymedesmia sp. n. MRB-2018]
MQKKPLLVIIYNHKYVKNIAIIEQIYGARFSQIHHLMPFYQGDKENVSSVYDSSYYFQGYISQGLRDYYQKNISHYVFIADDLLLNPAINEDNYQDFFKLQPQDCYLHKIENLVDKNGCISDWSWNDWAHNFSMKNKGLEELHHLPSFAQAVALFKRHNLLSNHFGKQLKVNYRYILSVCLWRLRNRKGLIEKVKWAIWGWPYFFFRRWQKNKQAINYPLARGYSDIVIIAGSEIKQFCYYSGIFSAVNLFVEIAIPTSLVLMDANVVDCRVVDKKTWDEVDVTNTTKPLQDKHQNNLNSLLKDFPADVPYLHPIKLSVWQTK